jgi:Zn-dependent peptidase ImmA (M78 family)
MMSRSDEIPPFLRERTWRHPSVRALRETFGKDLSPEQTIRRRAEELIRYAHRFGWAGPPYDPRVLASILGIRVKERNLAAGTDGVLHANDRGDLKILVNTRTPPSRQNFTICHEIAHTLFPDFCEIVRMRRQKATLENYHYELEALCNLAASELLMPMDKFARDVVYHGYSLKSVDTLKKQYAASPEAVVRRMVSTELEISCAVLLRRMYKPSEEKPQTARSSAKKAKKLRVEYTLPSLDFHCFIPRFKSVPNHSCINKAPFSRGVLTATEDWSLQNTPRFRIEAWAQPSSNGASREHPRVIAFLFPTYF